MDITSNVSSNYRVKEVQSRLQWCDSYSRLPTLLSIARELDLSNEDLLYHLGGIWSDCDNISLHPVRDLLQRLHAESPGILEGMMTLEEQTLHRKLPRRFKVYRGCYWKNILGLSHSLDREVATAFPGLRRYRMPGKPILVTAMVNREDCVLKTDRNEHEIVAVSRSIKSIELIKKQVLSAALTAHETRCRQEIEQMIARADRAA
jgi:hypothetical protein